MSDGGFGDVSTNPEIAGNNLAINAMLGGPGTFGGAAIASGNQSTMADTSGKGNAAVSSTPTATPASTISPAVAQLSAVQPGQTSSQATAAQTAAASQANDASQAITAGLAGMPTDPQSWYDGLNDSSKKSIADAWGGNQSVSLPTFIKNMYDTHVMAAFNPDFAKLTEAAGIAPVAPTASVPTDQSKKVATTDVKGSDVSGAPPEQGGTVAPSELAAQYAQLQAPTAPLARVPASQYGDVPSDQKAAVMAVQQQLAKAGYYHDGIDGLFGPITQRAVQQYRAANNLGAGGTVDAATLAHLNENYSLQPSTVTGTSGPGEVPAIPAIPAGVPKAAVPVSTLWESMTPSERANAEKNLGGGMSLVNPQPVPEASVVIAKAEAGANDPYQTWQAGLTADQTAVMATAAQKLGMSASDYAKAVYYGHMPMPTPQTPNTAAPTDPLAARMSVLEAQGAAGKPYATPDTGGTKRFGTLPQGRPTTGATISPMTLNSPDVTVTPAAVPIRTPDTVAAVQDITTQPAEIKDQSRLPSGPYFKDTSSVPLPRPRPERTSYNDMAGMTQLAGNLPPAASETLPSDLQPLTVPDVTSETWRAINEAAPGGQTPMGVTVPAPPAAPQPSAPVPTKGPNIRVNDAQLNTPVHYDAVAYQSYQPGQKYYDPQGNLRMKLASGGLMAA